MVASVVSSGPELAVVVIVMEVSPSSRGSAAQAAVTAVASASVRVKAGEVGTETTVAVIGS